MNLTKIIAIGLSIISLSACKSSLMETSGTNPALVYHGRTLAKSNSEMDLISPASYLECQFGGDSCVIALANHAEGDNYNYVVVEVDHTYIGRLNVINKLATNFTIHALKKSAKHLLRLFKATEALTGIVTVSHLSAGKINPVAKVSKKRIEFIGNSITCGFGSDIINIPCGNGSKWYDQHNAYYSYATQIGLKLDADFTLSAISGAGIYRNWNSDAPTVPQQFNLAYLNIDSIQTWDSNIFIPDVVTLELGTNDLSPGDGKKSRLPFDATVFENTYIDFLKKIYDRYPNTQIVLMNSPMVSGDRNTVLVNCLKNIQAKIISEMPEKKKIKLFQFTPIFATGCTGHPSKAEHALMTQQLLPFIRQVFEELK